MSEIKEANSDHEIERCFPLLLELRPHLVREKFVEQVNEQRSQGYRLAYLKQDSIEIAAMGFRILKFLAWGKVLYIDDLITHLSARGLGLGGKLLDYAREQAKDNDCQQIHLDTGYHRQDAHRLYLNKGFELSCHHLKLDLSKSN